MKQLFVVAALALLASCGSKSGSDSATTDSTKVSAGSSAKVPTFTVEETTTKAQYLMVMSDSAATSDEIGQKFGVIFGKIGECAAKCKMEEAGPPVAWYSGPAAPWKFEAGIPYATKCEHPEAGISTKEIPAGKAVAVHFFGPYDQMEKAYEAGMQYMKEKNLTAAAPPYEVYIGDPQLEPDPYKVQTDVVFPVK